jgi:hypothetical protein
MSFRDKKKYFRDIWGLNYRDTGCFLQNLLEYGKLVPVKDTAIEFMGVGMFSYAISVCTVVVHFFFVCILQFMFLS